MGHPHHPSSQVPEACSSAYQPGSVTLHFVALHLHACFVHLGVAVGDVQGHASLHLTARLGHRSLCPVI